MKIKAVIFDLDGTIADTVPLTTYSIREVVGNLTGKILSDEDVLKEFGPIDTEIIKIFVDADKKDISTEMYVQHFEDNFSDFVKPMEGIGELLQFLKSRGIKIGLFTGRSHRVTEIILKKLNLKKYFNAVVAGDFTTNPKPDPEGIIKALKLLGAGANESMYVGDFDVDIRASKAAGTDSVLALWSSTADEELIHLKPDKNFKSPFEFIEWLDSDEA